VNNSEKAHTATMQALAIRTAIEYQDVVAPELLDTITGSTPDEIRQSAERAKATSQRLVQRVMSELHTPADMDPAWAAANVLEGATADDQLAARVQSMSLAEYAHERSSLTGQGQSLVDFLSGGGAAR
jgi:hypothetical protein